jgi:hypothetical protein
MPRGFDHVGAAGYDGKIYAVDGFTGGDAGAVADVYDYTLATDIWEVLPSLPAPRVSVAAAQLDGRMYAIGGRHISDVNTHEAYAPVIGVWEELPPLPTPSRVRWDHGRRHRLRTCRRSRGEL